MTERHLGMVSRFEGWSALESDLRTGSFFVGVDGHFWNLLVWSGFFVGGTKARCLQTPCQVSRLESLLMES